MPKQWPYISDLQFTPICERSGWVPYGKQSWNGPSQGSSYEPCSNIAQFKVDGLLVCPKHSRKKSDLRVEIAYRYGHGRIEVARESGELSAEKPTEVGGE